jgi:outer membrane lipoprotein-sorting protein
MIFKMKRLLPVIALFFISFTFQAQNSQKARNLLDEVSAKVKSYDNIAIDFKYSLTNPKENLNQESKGNVIMQGNKYVLNFMGVTKIYDGKKNI